VREGADLQEREVNVSTQEPAVTVGWPESQPLYWTKYYPDDREILATVHDHHGTHLFTVLRDRDAAAGGAPGTPYAADPRISSEVVRRLQQEDWELNAVYRVD
jgi:hypothetical protein